MTDDYDRLWFGNGWCLVSPKAWPAPFFAELHGPDCECIGLGPDDAKALIAGLQVALDAEAKRNA